jgi:hypothetical protein
MRSLIKELHLLRKETDTGRLRSTTSINRSEAIFDANDHGET